MPPAPSSRIAYLDGLRAVSILLVLGYHLAPAMVPGGFVGVDVFFVLSGFLISGLIFRALQDGAWRVSDFYARRVRRLFPTLSLVMAATFLAGFMYLPPVALLELGHHLIAGAGFGSNLLLWGEAGYFDVAASQKPLMHLWSLGVEEQFYLAWPWLLWAGWRLGGARALRTLLPVIAALSFGVCVWLSLTHPTAAFYAPWSRVWELALGGLIAGLGADRDQGRARADILAVLGLAAICGVGFGMGPGAYAPAGSAIGPVLGACALLWVGPRTVVNRVLAFRPFVWLGELSYALYLWHWPLFVFASRLAPAPLPAAARVEVACLSVALAWLTVRFIERPFLRREPTVGRTIGLCVAMLGVASLGGAAIFTEGFPSRFPSDVRALIAVPLNQDRGEALHCFLEPDLDASSFGPTCVDRTRSPRMVVWGDSHAAAITSGLKARTAEEGFSLSQLTASMCPPILGHEEPDRPLCAAINASVLEIIRGLHPDVVVLHSVWRYKLDGLDRTVDALHAAGVGRVVVVGAVPFWRQSLPDAVVDYASSRLSRPLLPARVGGGAVSVVGDSSVRAALGDADAVFVSACEALCDADGCLTRVGDGVGQLTSYDGGHLSPPGAAELIRRIEPMLWGPIRLPGAP